MWANIWISLQSANFVEIISWKDFTENYASYDETPSEVDKLQFAKIRQY